MASPTWAEAASELKNGVKPFTDLFTIFPTLVTSINTAEQAFEGDFIPAAHEAAFQNLRSGLSSVYSRAAQRAIWDAWAREVMRIAGLAETDTSSYELWARLHRYMHDNSYTFNDRDWTRGNGTAGGSNVGSGTLKRLTVDWEGYAIQHGHVETKTFECVMDQNLGRLKGDEVFSVSGEDRSKDMLDYQGSGIFTTIGARNAGSSDTGTRLSNPSFDQTFSGSGSDKIPGWTIGGTAGNVTAATSSNIFRAAPGVTTANSNALAFAAAAGVTEVTQALSLQRLSAFSEWTPWMLMVAYKKTSAGATGTLNLKMGNKTTALDLSTIGDTSWHQLFFTIDKNVYYRNWKEDSPDIEVEVDTLSAGILYIDDLIFAPWTQLDGTWWWLSGGATAFLHRDTFTAADSGPTAATSELMYSLDYARVPVSLPSATGGAETVSDP